MIDKIDDMGSDVRVKLFLQMGVTIRSHHGDRYVAMSYGGVH